MATEALPEILGECKINCVNSLTTCSKMILWHLNCCVMMIIRSYDNVCEFGPRRLSGTVIEINVKNSILLHLLTAAFKDLHIKNSKNHKKVILPASHWLCVNALLNNITFLWFLLFLMCKSLNAAVNKCINCCFVHLYLLFYFFTNEHFAA